MPPKPSHDIPSIHDVIDQPGITQGDTQMAQAWIKELKDDETKFLLLISVCISVSIYYINGSINLLV